MSNRPIQFVETIPSGTVPLSEVALHLHPDDNIVIARVILQSGTILKTDDMALIIRQFTPSGHKIALRAIAAGQPVRRYGQIIGFASAPIEPGDHVHFHNLSVADFARDYAFGLDVKPVDYIPEAQRRTFNGYHRPDG